MIYLVTGGGQDVVVARDDEVRDSLTKMMTTKADSGMSGIFHNLGNVSLRTIAFLLVSTISILLIVGVSIGLICRVQVIQSASVANVRSYNGLFLFSIFTFFQHDLEKNDTSFESPKMKLLELSMKLGMARP